MIANLLENPLIPSSYIVFDVDPIRVQSARQAGFPVIFGDGSRAAVLEAAGVENPRAFFVCHRNKEQVGVVGRIRRSVPQEVKLRSDS